MSKISLLVPDLSLETYNRTKTLYEMLKANYELEVVSINKDKKTKLFKESFEDFKHIKYDLGTVINDLKKNVTGDIIYAIKAKPTSYGLAMSLKNIKKLPVVLDISANEPYNCFPYTNNVFKGILSSFYLVNDTNSYLYTKILEKRIKLADELTVSSNTLQRMYGGTLITSSANENIFNPYNYKVGEIRKTMGWGDKKVILFGGTFNKDTDIELLINTVEEIYRGDLILAIIGDNKKIKESKNVQYISYQPPENMAKLIASSDLVVIPQKDTLTSFGKIPIKFYESVSSAIPVLCPDTYDFNDSLSDYCYKYKAGNKDSLSGKILEIVNNYDIAKEKAKLLRQEYIDSFGFNKMSSKLTEFFSKIENKAIKE